LLKAKIRLLEPLQTQNGPFLDQAHKINAESYQRQSMRHQTGPAKTFLHGQDPLQVVLIGLKFMAELIEDMPNGHPGCIVATAVYQDRLFDRDVRAANERAVIGWRRRFRAMFDDVVAVYPPRDTFELDHLADMVSTVIEGGIIMARAVGEPAVTMQQILMLRLYLKLLFAPRDV
jgi:TetR/AcrR family transcriptional repressor of nem operon